MIRGDETFEIYNDVDATEQPNKLVHREETLIAQSIDPAVANKVLFPQRPGYGTLGQSNILHSNFVSLTASDRELFCYSFHIKNSESGRRPSSLIGRRVISKLLSEQFRPILSGFATDYHSTVVSCSKILWEGSYRVMLHPSSAYSAVIYEVYFDEMAAFCCKYLASPPTGVDTPGDVVSQSQALKTLNVVLGHLLRKDALSVSAARASHIVVHLNSGSNIASSCGSGLEMQECLSISMYSALSRILMTVSARYLSCYQARSLSTVIRQHFSKHGSTAKLEIFLKGLRVHLVTAIDNYQGRKFGDTVEIISGLARRTDGSRLQHPPRVARYGAGPRDVEVFQEVARASLLDRVRRRGYQKLIAYFEQAYGITLSVDMPVVNVGTSEHPIYFPVELCVVDAGQSARAGISDPNIYSKRIQPQTKFSDVKKHLTRLGLNGPLNPILAAFGIHVSSNPITVYSRALPTPQVLYAAGEAARVVQGAWSAHSLKVIRPAALQSLLWVYLDVKSTHSPSVNPRPTFFSQGLHLLAKVLRHMGIVRSLPMVGRIFRLDSDKAKSQIKVAISSLKEEYSPPVLLVITSARARALGHVARVACDITYGIPVIDIPEESLAGAYLEVYAKIGLRINLKLGGENHVVSHSELDFFGNGKTMIVGLKVAFVTSQLHKSTHTVVGLVASSDSHLTQWPGETFIRQGRHPYVQNLDVLLQSRIRLWMDRNGNSLPEDIVIYRRMASGSNHVSWIETELPLVKAACRASYPVTKEKESPECSARIAVIFVYEDHQARFFPTIDTDAHSLGSPRSGTIVDRGISEPRCWDFFLYSGYSTSATNKPTRYLVIMDEVFRRRGSVDPGHGPADLLQDLTHKLCYLSGTRATHVCLPVYYASQACERIRTYFALSGSSSSSLSTVFPYDNTGKKGSDSLLRIHPAVHDSMFYV